MLTFFSFSCWADELRVAFAWSLFPLSINKHPKSHAVVPNGKSQSSSLFMMVTHLSGHRWSITKNIHIIFTIMYICWKIALVWNLWIYKQISRFRSQCDKDNNWKVTAWGWLAWWKLTTPRAPEHPIIWQKVWTTKLNRESGRLTVSQHKAFIYTQACVQIIQH